MHASVEDEAPTTTSSFPYNDPTNLAFDLEGDLLVTTFNPSNNYIYHIDLNANEIESSQQ